VTGLGSETLPAAVRSGWFASVTARAGELRATGFDENVRAVLR
jgi:hypothetical protein